MTGELSGSDCKAFTSGGRRVLLAVTGLTPQVVTETVYALAREGRHALPSEVHLVTTAEGAERARLALLSDQPGWFKRFLSDMSLGSIDFCDRNIHVIVSPDGKALQDIRDASDNIAAADQIAELVRRFTEDDVAHLHVSLAGGRKTLGFLAGYSLSLWGRASDRLTHVLVSEPFESTWDFFYPTPYERIIETRGGKLADCATAEVTLADIPFVRLRHGLPRELLTGRARFAQAVARAQARLGPPCLELDLEGGEARMGGRPLTLAPADLAFLAWFARRAQGGAGPVACPADGAPSLEYARAYLAEYDIVRGANRNVLRRYRSGMAKSDFEERKSRLNRALRDQLGEIEAAPYLVAGTGRRPMQYQLRLRGEDVLFVHYDGSASAARVAISGSRGGAPRVGSAA